MSSSPQKSLVLFQRVSICFQEMDYSPVEADQQPAPLFQQTLKCSRDLACLQLSNLFQMDQEGPRVSNPEGVEMEILSNKWVALGRWRWLNGDNPECLLFARHPRVCKECVKRQSVLATGCPTLQPPVASACFSSLLQLPTAVWEVGLGCGVSSWKWVGTWL